MPIINNNDYKGYFTKEFKSPMVKNFIETGSAHIDNEDQSETRFNIYTKVYPDGVITLISPKTGKLSISFDYGANWINKVTNLTMKNVRRVDKETFVFEIVDGNGDIHTGITYNVFMTYEIINTVEQVPIKCKNEPVNAPYTFIGDSLCKVNEYNKTYEILESSLPPYCALCDSVLDNFIYLITPSTSNYTIFKYDPSTNDRIQVFSEPVIEGVDIINFNVLNVGSADAFVVTFSNLQTRIIVPPYINSNIIIEYSFKDIIINETNCDSDSFFVKGVSDKLFVFSSSLDQMEACSIYRVSTNGSLEKIADKIYSDGLYIKERTI